MAAAASERSDSSGASPSPRWGERARVRVATRSFLPVGRWRPLLEPGGFGRLPVLGGRWAREHCVEALLQQRYSGRPGRTAGRRSPRLRCRAGPDERDPRRHPPGHAHGAQRAAPTVPAQAVAGSAVVVVSPRRVLVQTRGPPHACPEGCEFARARQPPAVVLDDPPWRILGTDGGGTPHHRCWNHRSHPRYLGVRGRRQEWSLPFLRIRT